jgi:isopenicillin-N N-acyltransferase-like protein
MPPVDGAGRLVVVDCRGGGRARGRAHGEHVRELIRAGLGRWEEAVAAAHGVGLDVYVADFLGSTELVGSIDEVLPELGEEIRGIAEGAGVGFDVIAVYNCMDEQWWHDAERARGAAPGCSVVAGRTSAGVFVAQNMDLPHVMDGGQLVLRISGPGQPEALVLSAAGLVGLTGVNRAGVGVCVNTLLMLAHARRGLPVAAVVRGILAQASRAEAEAFVRSASHASGQHYAIADRDGVVGLEACAEGVVVSSPVERPRLAHTNHPLVHTAIDDRFEAILQADGSIANSLRRLKVAAAGADVLAAPGEAERVLEDRSGPLCVHASDPIGGVTFAGIVITMTDEPRVRVCPGPPTPAGWRDIAWSPPAAR